MNKRIFGIGMVLTVFAVLAISATPAYAHVDVYFSPDPSTISLAPGENVSIQVMADVDGAEDGIRGFQVGIDYNPGVVNITDIESPCKVMYGPYCVEYWWKSTFTGSRFIHPLAPYGDYVWFTGYDNYPGHDSPITAPIANLTIEGIAQGTSILYFTQQRRCDPPNTVGLSRLFNSTNEQICNENVTWINKTISCAGEPVTVTFTKTLTEGWNLISLPLTNETDMTVANIIDTSLSGSYDALDRYDASTHSFVALSSTDTMENGVGYFINMTADDTWTYSGSAYTSMNVGLSEGLNMVGWLNCSKDITDALSSIEGNYYYVARWNATSQSFETYNPVAPPVFNDFTMMDRGEGYFISMKTGDTLDENCGA